MKLFKRTLLILVLITLSACAVSPSASPAPLMSPLPEPTSSATPPQVPAAAVTLQPTLQPTADQSQNALQELIKNSTFIAPNYNKSITLRDGKYEAGAGADYLLVQILPPMALGDLNGDGKDEAAVLLGENGGGSGVFVSLIVLTFKNGTPIQSGSALIDDRPKIHALSIKNSQVILDAIIHGPTDAMVNPTLPVTETYQIISNTLVMTRFASKTPDGHDRSINISSPASQAGVKGSVKVQGSMPIAPFENNLSYRVYDTQGKQVAKGPFPVKASKPGGKATFDYTVKIPALPTGTAIRLELSETSAKDGSIMTLDSVNLLIN